MRVVMSGFLFIFFSIFFIYVVCVIASSGRGSKAQERDKFAPNGYPKNPHMICPHCQTKGEISTKTVDLTKGVSGGKATGAILTGGASLLVTGLSRKEKQTEAHCWKCGNIWHF